MYLHKCSTHLCEHLPTWWNYINPIFLSVFSRSLQFWKNKSLDCIWNQNTFSCHGLHNFFWNKTLCACKLRLNYVTVCITYSQLLLQPDAPVFLFLLLILHSVAWKSKNACHQGFEKFKRNKCKHNSISAWTKWNFSNSYKGTPKYTAEY